MTRLFSTSGHFDRGTWLFVLLAFAVLAPAAGLLWFMNEAVTAQTAAARQAVLESYRGQLRLVRSRVDARWGAYAARLRWGSEPETRFARLVLEDGVDGAVLLDPDGSVRYPRPAAAVNLRGPLPSADRLNDYARTLPAVERLFLMSALRAAEPNVSLPTQAALALSLQIGETGLPPLETTGFQRTAVPDVWALASEDRRLLVLFRTGRLEAMMHDLLHEVAPEGIVFIASPPGVEADAEAIAAGPWLPGWQLSFWPIDSALLDAAARSRATFSVTVGLAGLGIVALLGLTAGGVFRRQIQLARLKTDLVTAVSHELRTPLTSMRVLVEGLMADETLDPVKTRAYLDLISTENARLSRLIENFLTFSRLDRGRYQFVFGPVEPGAVVASALAAMRDRVPSGTDVRAEVATGLPLVRADADALVTALINLIDNALKYTPADKRIVVRAERDAGTVAFAVEDNGIGIPAREHRRIFGRFYRVDPRLSGDTTGVGLGLSIVGAIARAHGGTVAVRSQAGQGSTFTLRCPAIQRDATV